MIEPKVTSPTFGIADCAACASPSMKPSIALLCWLDGLRLDGLVIAEIKLPLFLSLAIICSYRLCCMPLDLMRFLISSFSFSVTLRFTSKFTPPPVKPDTAVLSLASAALQNSARNTGSPFSLVRT